MKKFILPLAAILLLAASPSLAQNDSAQNRTAQDRVDATQDRARNAEEKAKLAQDQADAAREKARSASDQARTRLNELNDYDEIVIKRKNDDKDEKVTVEIKGDKVFVNGEPIDKFTDDAVSVRVRRPRHYELIAPASPFRFPYSTWSLKNGNMYNGGEYGSGAFLGVTTDESSDGARIVSVSENSAAAKAGLKADDVITKVNDKTISDPRELSEAINGMKPDDKVRIIYLRNGKEKKTTATLQKRAYARGYQRSPANPGEAPEPLEPLEPGQPPMAPIPPMQFNFDELGDGFNRAFSIDGKARIGIRVQDTEDGKGVKVLAVDDGSAADKAGIKDDDIITSFDGKTVNSAGELADASRASRDKSSVKIQLKRNGKSQEIELKVPKKLKTANL